MYYAYPADLAGTNHSRSEYVRDRESIPHRVRRAVCSLRFVHREIRRIEALLLLEELWRHALDLLVSIGMDRAP
jgi:hypothetical protein